jgi:hypothetical protein
MRWAILLARVFAVDALRCPDCGARLRLIAAIEDEAIARAILECLELPARAPPIPSVPTGISSPDPTCNGSFGDEPFDFDQTPPFEDP